MSRASTLLVTSERRGTAPRRSSMSLVRGAPRGPLVTRRRLQLALALLWLLDGALQLQPFMFTRGFADRVIAPSAGGQPGMVEAAVHWSAMLILGHPAVWDGLFAAVQLVIGLALLSRRTARLAVAASVAWSLGVWVFGEGTGGVAGGTATFLTGAPGAVVLYGLIGLAAWPRLAPGDRAALASRSTGWRARLDLLVAPAADERPATWVPALWATLWGLFALLRALPGNDAARALARQLQANVTTAPGWLAHAERALANAAGHDGWGPVMAMAAVELAVGLLALWQGPPRRAAAGAGIGVALAVWVVGQAFGQIPTGMGTDPNSGLLVALLGIALAGCTRRAPTAAVASTEGHRSPRRLPRREAA